MPNTNPVISLYNHIQSHESIKSGFAIAIVWNADDILELENPETGKPYGLTEGEAQEILADLDNHHDANFGINWDTIHNGINDCLRRRTPATEETASA